MEATSLTVAEDLCVIGVYVLISYVMTIFWMCYKNCLWRRCWSCCRFSNCIFIYLFYFIFISISTQMHTVTIS